MPIAAITIAGNQAGNPDWPINTLVQLGNAGIGGETSYDWVIRDQPPGTPDTLSSTTITNPTFTPRKEGSYLIHLTVNGTLADTNVVGVRQLKTRTRIPAAGEQSEMGAQRGHAQDANQLLQLLDALRADPMLIVAQAGESLTKNNVVRFTSMATIKTGLPGQEIVPVVGLALATSATVQLEQLGVIVGNVDLTSDSVSSGSLVLVRMGGVQKASGLSGSAGNAVYVSDLGVLALTPGTFQRQMGALLSAADVMMQFGIASGSGVTLASTTPAAIALVGAVGVGTTVARADHVHAHGNMPGDTLHALVTQSIAGFMSAADKSKLDGISPGSTSVSLGTSAPQSVGTINLPGDATAASRENHVHAHGDQPGGSMHALVVSNGNAGFMSGTDKAKLDGIAAGATNTPLSSSAPPAISNVGSAGVNSVAARGDHTHAHGDQLGGTQHQLVTIAIAGFMSPADKAKLDELDPDVSGALGLASTAPPDVAAAGAVGVSTSAARGDHTHGHGNQLGGTLHATATTVAAGFMSAADKTKLDGIATGATNLQLSSTLPTALGTAAIGVGTTAARADHVHPHNLATTNPAAIGVTAIGTSLTAARSDHVHAHGNQSGGSLHAIATTTVAGFLSSTDKALIDTGFARLVGGNLFTGGNQDILGSVNLTGSVNAGSSITAGGWTATFAGDVVGDVHRSNSYEFNSPVNVPRYANMVRDVTVFSGPDTPPSWTYAQNDSNARWLNLGPGNSPIYIALNPVHGETLQLVVLTIQPISAKPTLGTRMRARLYIINASGNITYLDAGLQYDNGSSAAQQIIWSLSRTVNLTLETYAIVLYASNTSGDSLYAAACSGVLSVLPPF